MAQHPDPVLANIPSSRSYARGKFGRLFPSLPPCLEDTPEARTALRKLARNMIGAERNNRDVFVINQHSSMPAGYTYFGQFIAHDISFDTTSINERQTDPEFLWNFRTPALDLDSVYGGGPDGSPFLFNKYQKRTHFLIGQQEIDKELIPGLPRNQDDTALISDPRNDENLIISQLHLAFLLFHNKIASRLTKNRDAKDPRSQEKIFFEAKQLASWTFQWMVLFDYLPRIVNLSQFTAKENEKTSPGLKEDKQLEIIQQQINAILRDETKRQYYDWRNEPFIPVEFSGAAFRFGHVQVKKLYRFQRGDEHFSKDLFPRPKTKLDWSLFFPQNGLSQNFNNKIRPVISFKLDFVPFAFLSAGPDLEASISTKIKEAAPASEIIEMVLAQENQIPDINNLAYRNLIRGVLLKLPSGQSIARSMSLQPLSIEAAEEFKDNTPLWYYILQEASVENDGERLGPVGSRIVTEVIIGLIQGDKKSFINQHPLWRPLLPDENGTFNVKLRTMTDFLKYAGVYPDFPDA
jgi:hypothetical protein